MRSGVSVRGESPGRMFWASGLGHEPEPLPLVRSPDAVCAQFNRPNGVRLRFQVCRHKVEPAVPSCVCNLLAKDSLRAALADEPKPRWPEMPCVSAGLPFARRGEGLAGAGAGPNRSVAPSGELERERPAANASEEVALGVAAHVVGLDFGDAPLIHVSSGQVARRDQVPQPLGDKRLIVVVVDMAHWRSARSITRGSPQEYAASRPHQQAVTEGSPGRVG